LVTWVTWAQVESINRAIERMNVPSEQASRVAYFARQMIMAGDETDAELATFKAYELVFGEWGARADHA
jgi:hypothetical protein